VPRGSFRCRAHVGDRWSVVWWIARPRTSCPLGFSSRVRAVFEDHIVALGAVCRRAHACSPASTKAAFRRRQMIARPGHLTAVASVASGRAERRGRASDRRRRVVLAGRVRGCRASSRMRRYGRQADAKAGTERAAHTNAAKSVVASLRAIQHRLSPHVRLDIGCEIDA